MGLIGVYFDLYRSFNSSVFCKFLDVSKALDRVNHITHFKKLNQSGAPGCILGVLIYWYNTNAM